jgi:hypothetical protein
MIYHNAAFYLGAILHRAIVIDFLSFLFAQAVLF